MRRTALFAAVSLTAVLVAGAAAAQSISVGETVSGSITTSDPIVEEDGSHYDCWVFRAPAGNYTVDYRSADFDAFVGVGRGSDCGVPVEFYNDDGDEGLDSHLEFATDGGSWFIKANTLEGGETGDYTLTLTAGGDPSSMDDMGDDDFVDEGELDTAWIDDLAEREGGDAHLLNVLCAAVDTLDLIVTMEGMDEDRLMARIEEGVVFTVAANRSGAGLGFSESDVENQIGELGATLLMDPESSGDFSEARQECMDLV